MKMQFQGQTSSHARHRMQLSGSSMRCFGDLPPEGPAQPSFCSAKYIQNDGTTTAKIKMKNHRPTQNTTAVVQVHSKVLTVGSTRCFSSTNLFGTLMRYPSSPTAG